MAEFGSYGDCHRNVGEEGQLKKRTQWQAWYPVETDTELTNAELRSWLNSVVMVTVTGISGNGLPEWSRIR